MELEKKALAGIIQFLDEQEGETLKRHPKVKKAEKVEEKEEVLESKSEEMSEDDMSPEMIKKILEMYEENK